MNHGICQRNVVGKVMMRNEEFGEQKEYWRGGQTILGIRT